MFLAAPSKGLGANVLGGMIMKVRSVALLGCTAEINKEVPAVKEGILGDFTLAENETITTIGVDKNGLTDIAVVAENIESLQ